MDIFNKMKDPKKVKRGKKAKAGGGTFELRVRKDLEMREWIVSKWPNNLECVLYDNPKGNFSGDIKIVPAKPKFLFGKPVALGTGFPDFVAFRNIAAAPQGKYIVMKNKCVNCSETSNVEFRMNTLSEVIGIEAKMNGKLKKEEQEKCRWYLDNQIFSKILIAKKTKEKGRIIIVYTDFMEQYG